jgi:nanoRNase/pAp phosphatase (c-di-AMP/oligoRNAs hydrolase)
MRSIPSGEKFIEFIKKYRGTVVLVMHHQADLDAVGSTLAMIHLISVLNQNIAIRVLEPNLSQLSQKMMTISSYQFNHIKIDEINIPVLFILLDMNQINFGPISSKNSYIIFDHHIPIELDIHLIYDFRLPNFRSTTELISCLYHQVNVPLTLEIARSLIAGIIFDTRRFLYSDQKLFECISYLLSSNPEAYLEAQTLFSSSKSISERTASLKAAQRMRRIQIDDIILLISHVSSYEAAAARSLILLGGDIVIVIANRKTETRISLRISSEFQEKTKLSLGKDVVPALIAKFGGTGGGHDAAAGYNTGVLEVDAIKTFFHRYFDEKLQKKQ